MQVQSSVEVRQDLLTASLLTSARGSDTEVLETLTPVFARALALARASASAGRLQVRAGAVSLLPYPGPQGGPSFWIGTAELILDGQDVSRIWDVAARMDGLAIQRLEWGVSSELRERAEREAGQQALASFNAQAEELGRGLGFEQVTLGDIALTMSQHGLGQRSVELGAAGSGAPLPLDPLDGTLMATVQGMVRMHGKRAPVAKASIDAMLEHLRTHGCPGTRLEGVSSGCADTGRSLSMASLA